MTTPPLSWYVLVARFGTQTERTSTLGHLSRDGRRTLCGAELAASEVAPESFIRCTRCVLERRAQETA